MSIDLSRYPHWQKLVAKNPAYLPALEKALSGKTATNPSANTRNGKDQANPPSWLAQAWTLASAVGRFVGDGFRTVTPEQYAARLAICDACEFRDGNRCSICRCFVAVKARLPKEGCPKDKWPAIQPAEPAPAKPQHRKCCGG